MTVAWVFPGQGAQSVGMGRDLYERIPAAREVFEQADAALDLNLARLCFEGPEDVLTATENAQPAILTVSVALLRAIESLLLAEQIPRPSAVAGHSLGEYAALVAGGCLDLQAAVRLVRRRGELMAESHEGTMIAVLGLTEQKLDQICLEVSENTGQSVVIANYNAPEQLVISGATLAVQQVSKRAKEQGAKRVTALKVSAAFHSPLMELAAQGMHHALTSVALMDMQVPLIANVTAQPITMAEDVRHELVAQITSPVRWSASVERLIAQGISTFVEIGPGNVLTGLIKRIAPGVQLVNVRDAESIATLTLR